MIEILVVGIVAFVSTNIDDLVLLTGLLADPSNRRRTVLAGHGIAIAFIIAVSLAASAVLASLPRAYILSLGLGPIFIGGLKLATWVLRRTHQSAAEETKIVATDGTIFGVAAAVSAAGGDNLAAYIPLFAAHDGRERAFIVMSFVALAALWSAIAFLLASRLCRNPGISFATTPTVACLLMALGIYSVWSAAAP